MPDRLAYLESLHYDSEIPFFQDDLQEDLERIYIPRDVANISNMDNNLSYEFLVALDNKGYLSENVALGKGIHMQTMDLAIEKRDLHYLYVQVSTAKPFLSCSIWRYLKKSQDLVVLAQPWQEDHQKALAELASLAQKYDLVFVSEADLQLKVSTAGQIDSFYKKYFDEFSDH